MAYRIQRLDELKAAVIAAMCEIEDRDDDEPHFTADQIINAVHEAIEDWINA